MRQLFILRRAALSSALALILSTSVIYSRVATASDLGREVLRRGDGWGSYGRGVTGGSAADSRHVFVVSTWQQLRDALGGTRAHQQTTPRIIYVRGTINAMARSNGQGTWTCDTIARQVTVAGTGRAFSMADFIRHFNPAGPWGRRTPAGPLEDARRAATRLQLAQIQQRFGSNVSLIGLGRNARIVGAHLLIRQVSNVIVRNLRISDAYDCFPEWDPNDGSAGNWNGLYDNISIMTTQHAWIDHVTLDNGVHPPQSLPTVFGRRFQVHDGLLDITHGSNYVTVSYNIFDNHDKVNLIGSSDSRVDDRGKLKVTIHHNLWRNPGQRGPRVRFGQVDIYNNYVEVRAARDFTNLWGVGIESGIYAEKNAIDLASGIPASRIIRRQAGHNIFTTDNLVNGVPTDLLAVYNAAASAANRLTNRVGWVPRLRLRVNSGREVRAIVTRQAGAGIINSAMQMQEKEVNHTNLPMNSQRTLFSETGASSGDVDSTIHNK